LRRLAAPHYDARVRILGVAVCVLVGCGGGNAADDADAPTDQVDDASDDSDDDPPLPDAPVDAPAMWSSTPDCTATDIYATPTLPPLTPDQRGAIVGCTLGTRLDPAAVQTAMSDDGAEGVVAQTGAQTIKLAYRTVRSDGTATVSTATAYLPLEPRALPAPVVLVGRSTSGLADSCAPSRDEVPGANYILPFAARGFIVISPDFAGLGNDGAHAYLDNHEAAAQLFDAHRALEKLLPAGTVGASVGAVGYSQGGGVVLSAQGLEQELTGARTLKGIVAIAPEWPISSRSFGYEDVLRNPDRITALAGLAPPTVTVLRHYGFLANRVGEAEAGASFPASERDDLIEQINSLCTIPLGGALNAMQRHLRDLVDPAFRDQVLACIDGTPGCAGLGQEFHAWMESDYVTADPTGARVLIVQGLADQVMTAAGEAACDVAKLRAEGVEPQLCVDTIATHDSVLERRIEDVVAWIEAIATDQPAPTCGSQALPACDR